MLSAKKRVEQKCGVGKPVKLNAKKSRGKLLRETVVAVCKKVSAKKVSEKSRAVEPLVVVLIGCQSQKFFLKSQLVIVRPQKL
jgi:hypothetical protein